jgi:hypothetical protein
MSKGFLDTKKVELWVQCPKHLMSYKNFYFKGNKTFNS